MTNKREQTSEGYNSSGNRYRTFDDGSFTYKNTTSAGNNTNYFKDGKSNESFYQNSAIGYKTHTYSDGNVKTTWSK